MSRHFTCPQGHQWELSATATSLTAHFDPVCPLCGAPAQASAPGNEKPDSGSVRLALGPAPVEAATSAARVPAPLPVRQATAAVIAPPSPRPREENPSPSTSQVFRKPELAVVPQQEKPLPTASWLRHPLTASLATVCCLLPLLVIVGVVLPQRRIGQERQLAEEARQEAERQREEFSRRLQAEAAAKTEAVSQARAAEEARNEAIEARDKARLDAQRADQATQAMDKRRQEQANLREQAEVVSRHADIARQNAVNQHQQAEGRLIRLYAGQGARLLDQGELLEAFAWNTESLRLAAGDAAREAPARLQLASILSQSPRPVQMWFHDQLVTQALFSPDGRRVLTLCRDGKARLWYAGSGKLIGAPLAHGGEVTRAQFSRDGRRVLTAGADFMARVWDASNAQPITPPLEQAGAIFALATSPDDKRLHTVSMNGMTAKFQFHAWDARSGDPVGEPWEFPVPVRTAEFRPDGRAILVTQTLGRPEAYDLTGKATVSGFGSAETPHHLTYSTDSHYVLTCGPGVIARVWDASTGTAASLPLVHPDEPTLIESSPDGAHVVTACSDGIARIWDVATGRRVSSTARHRGGIVGATFSPDGRYVLTSCRDGTAHVWKAQTGEAVLPVFWHNAALLPGAAFSPDGTSVLTASDEIVRIWDLTTGELSSGPAPVEQRVVYTSDGKRFVRSAGDSAQLFAADSQKPVGQPLKHKHDISWMNFSADGRRLLTLSQKAGEDSAEVDLRVWDVQTGSAVGPPPEFVSLVRLAVLSPDGTRAAAANARDVVRIWNCTTGKDVKRALEHRNPVSHLVFSPDGRMLATATTAGEVRVWDASNGAPLSPPLKHQQAVTYLVFSPDSRRLFSASQDGTAQVSEAATGEAVVGPFLHRAAVLQLVLSADGRRAATAGFDGAVRLWDAKTAKLAAPALVHDSQVSQVAFSPDGRWLATASGPRFRLWDAGTGEPLGPPRRVSSSSLPITRLDFTKEGRLETTQGPPGVPGSHQIWDIAPDPRSVAELAQWAELLVGRRLDAQGAFVSVPAADLKKAWEGLHSRYAREFTIAPERRLAWHRREADECEKERQWPGVLLHLAALAESEPNRWQHRARRARVYAALKQWQDAAAEYRKALEADPDQVELLAGIARAEIELRMWESATQWLARVLKITPEDREAWALRGRAFGELSKLEQAAADLDKAISLGMNAPRVWHQRALLYLAAGDQAGYRKTCLHLRRRFGDSDDPQTLLLVGWTCALGPEALPDIKPLLKRLERAKVDTPESARKDLVQAALLYRTGQFAQAGRTLTEPAKKVSDELKVESAILLALCEHQLDHKDKAKESLAKVGNNDDPAMKSRLWDERLAVRVLRGEAEKLVGEKKP
jgi:WD40 repeat protein/Flp pilus assembly protein TadD